MGSLVMEAADHTRVPAGGAQAVDREAFSAWITEKIKAHPNIEVICEEVEALPEEEIVVCASGPLTSDALFSSIKALTGADTLYFYDAAAPIVTAESVDMTRAFWQSRYDKGEGADYLNCPLTAEGYRVFYDTLMGAEWIPTKDFEKEIFFEGCMPVETMAKRGYQTLLFGPMKPVGLRDPHTGETPFAVVQLRREDEEGRLLNMVGFQTRTKWGDQKKVIQTIPALANAEIVRYGVDASQHLPQRADGAPRHLPDESEGKYFLRRPDDRRGRLHRIDSQRTGRRDQRCAAGARRSAARFSANNGHRRADEPRWQFADRSFSADEHQFWPLAIARATPAFQKGAQRLLRRAGAGRSG